MSEDAEITRKALDQLYHSMFVKGLYNQVSPSLAKKLLSQGEYIKKALHSPNLYTMMYLCRQEGIVDAYLSIVEDCLAGKLSSEEAINKIIKTMERYRKGIDELGLNL